MWSVGIGSEAVIIIAVFIDAADFIKFSCTLQNLKIVQLIKVNGIQYKC